MTPEGHVEHVNRQVLEYFGRTLEELKQWGTTDAVHPADLPGAIAAWQHAVETGLPYEFEHRIRRGDGEYRWFQSRGLPLRDAEGRIVRWYNRLTDIDGRKHSEERLRRSEADLLEAQRLSHAGSWRHDLASGAFFVSPEVLRIRGVESAEPLSTIGRMYNGIHPDDRSRVRDTYEAAQAREGEFDAEYRIVLRDGTMKHLHTIGHPVLNEAGDIVEYVGTGMDVTEQRQAQTALQTAFEEIKHLKDRLQDENLALREEIDQAFMFEEIVGASAALKAVLSHVSKVAPTDSTVLISGETGTGKELIARAIHKHSRRADRAFVSLNCAATPVLMTGTRCFPRSQRLVGTPGTRRGRGGEG
jgi:PAS domain S-box-containing protein